MVYSGIQIFFTPFCKFFLNVFNYVRKIMYSCVLLQFTENPDVCQFLFKHDFSNSWFLTWIRSKTGVHWISLTKSVGINRLIPGGVNKFLGEYQSLRALQHGKFIIKFTIINTFVCTAYLRSVWFETKDNYSTYIREAWQKKD